MQHASHPHQFEAILVDDDLQAAVVFECSELPESIDYQRSAVMEFWKAHALALAPDRLVWVRAAPKPIRQLVDKLHGPLIADLCAAIQFEDQELVHDLQQGFPYAGVLPPAGVSVNTQAGIPKPLGTMSLA